MKLFSVVLILESQSQTNPYVGKTFTSKAKISFPAPDEIAANQMLLENFGHRMAANQQYKLKCDGEAAPGAQGFAITPIR